VLGWQAGTLTAAARGARADRASGLLDGGAACYQVYRTANGGHLSVGAVEAKFWAMFCTAIGRPDLTARQGEPMPQTALIAEVAAIVAAHTLAHWAEMFREVDCCVEPVLTPAEVPDHPQVAARGQVVRSGGLVEVLFGLHLDGDPPAPRTPLREAPVAAILGAWNG